MNKGPIMASFGIWTDVSIHNDSLILFVVKEGNDASAVRLRSATPHMRSGQSLRRIYRPQLIHGLVSIYPDATIPNQYAFQGNNATSMMPGDGNPKPIIAVRDPRG